MPEINAIATIHGLAGFQRLAPFRPSTAAKELAGFTMRFDRIKVPSGGGTTYVLPEPDVNGNTDFREIDAVILTHHPMQSYYAGKYNGGNARPECSSRDGNVGVGSPGGNCARCYLNQFGTAENNSKACKRKHRIYILREGEIFPIILDLPTLSVDGFGRYLRRLLTVGKDPNAIVTRFALKKAINKAGITYSQVTFTEGRDLLPEERTAVRRLAAQVQAYSSSGDFDADDADDANADAIPDYDPETGEILPSDPQGF